MAVPQVGSDTGHVVGAGLPRLLLRVGGVVCRLVVAMSAAAGQLYCGCGSTNLLMRATYPASVAGLPADDDAIARYTADGIRELEAYLVAVTGGSPT